MPIFRPQPDLLKFENHCPGARMLGTCLVCYLRFSQQSCEIKQFDSHLTEEQTEAQKGHLIGSCSLQDWTWTTLRSVCLVNVALTQIAPPPPSTPVNLPYFPFLPQPRLEGVIIVLHSAGHFSGSGETMAGGMWAWPLRRGRAHEAQKDDEGFSYSLPRTVRRPLLTSAPFISSCFPGGRGPEKVVLPLLGAGVQWALQDRESSWEGKTHSMKQAEGDPSPTKLLLKQAGMASPTYAGRLVLTLTVFSHSLCSWGSDIWGLSDQGETVPARAASS